jgi:Na+/melibiose symporter-like transporter
VLALTPSVVRESRVQEERTFDVAGAVTVTAGLALLVYAIAKAPDSGWGSAQTILELVAAAALIGAFLLIESRRKNPLMPLRIFRVRTLAGANVVGFLLGAITFSNFFILTLYVQNVLGYSALKTGVTFLATAGTVVVVAGLAQALVTRVGTKPVMAVGMALMTGGMLYYTQISPNGSFVADLLPGYLLVGFGLAFSFIPVSVAALAGVPHHQAGLASGLLNTSQQIGGAIGVALAATVSTTHAESLIHQGESQAEAFTSGFALAFWMLAGLGVAGVIASLTLIRREEEVAVDEGEPEPVEVLA